MDELKKELHRIAITTIVYNSDKKYLITRRSLEKKAFPGKWTVPGGGLTTDDYVNLPKTFPGHPQWYNTLEVALKREIKEEVDIEVGTPTYLLNLTFIRPDSVPVLVLSFYAPFISGEIKHDTDTIDHAWVTLEEAKKYDLIDGILHELELVTKQLKKK
jgi:ADP-ribose pyrophosphatase YjhB (NUDIX family)